VAGDEHLHDVEHALWIGLIVDARGCVPSFSIATGSVLRAGS
jgi:hypothetical protein